MFLLDRDSPLERLRQRAVGVMVGNVAKWGNSLAVRIPQHLAKEVDLIAGGEVEIG